MYNTAHLLLSLPGLLLHPPNHPNYIVSLYTTLLALRRCLRYQEQWLQTHHGMPMYAEALTPEMECQAWTLYAETGLLIIGAGLGGDTAPMWCRGIEGEIETAIQRGLHLCHSSRTSLREHYFHLTLLHAHLTHSQGNIKFSRSIIVRLKTHLIGPDLPHIHYQILLCEHANYVNPPPNPPSSSSPPPSPSAPSLSDIRSALNVIQELAQKAWLFGHADIVKLAAVMRLRTLIRGDLWLHHPGDPPDMSVEACLAATEAEVGLSFEEKKLGAEGNGLQPTPAVSVEPARVPSSSIICTFQTQVLFMSVLYYTQVGRSSDANVRLNRCHALIDALNDDSTYQLDGTATLNIPLERDYPLTIRVTHPRVLYELAYVVSSVSRRDPIGTKPKRKVFAEAGLRASGGIIADAIFPTWASLSDAQLVEDRLAKIKADLLCEIAAVCISRSEFEEAQHHLSFLIAHTRTYSIFPYYAARITLHQAHLAHATLHTDRALKCYRAAAILDSDTSGGDALPSGGRTSGFVRVAARAGEVALRLGLRAQYKRDNPRTPFNDDPGLDEMAREVIAECRTFSGTLRAIGALLEAVLSPEIVKAKQRLKVSLDIATTAQDNHLRALVVALTSAHYHNTASEHALKMLKTANRLAAGMGATENVELTERTIGNAPLGLWSGERLFELYGKQGQASSKEAEVLVARTGFCRQAVQGLPSRLTQEAPP